MGTSSINGPFSMAMLNNQSVIKNYGTSPFLIGKSQENHRKWLVSWNIMGFLTFESHHVYWENPRTFDWAMFNSCGTNDQRVYPHKNLTIFVGSIRMIVASTTKLGKFHHDNSPCSPSLEIMVNQGKAFPSGGRIQFRLVNYHHLSRPK